MSHYKIWIKHYINSEIYELKVTELKLFEGLRWNAIIDKALSQLDITGDERKKTIIQSIYLIEH